MNKREQVWLGIFLVIPLITAKAFADAFAPDEKMGFLYDILFGFVGVLLGYAVYYFTKEAKTKVRGVFAGLVIIIFILSIAFSTNSNAYPQTCQVCGYKAIEKNDPVCGHCFEEISEERMKEKGYNRIAELVYARQLYVFYQDSVEQVDFYKPEVSEDGYEKDKQWKPIIDKEDLLDLRNGIKAEK
ncbi:hypothetical protein [Rufibacter sp. LB8]|uniref:hypothetical protein n=1 Tax=Rufibacter sp. LB8 TaxID=2777781 RepID=UPI00178C3127|nr:hypothetical protein [Rufibacter sp. LB8]